MAGTITLVARTAMMLAALAVIAALLVGAADAAMRFLLRDPIASAYEIVEIAMTIALALGGPASLYLHRDRTMPASPAWLGRPGHAIVALLCAAFAGYVAYALVAGVAPKLHDHRSVALEFPNMAIATYALAAGFALIIPLALAMAGLAPAADAALRPLPMALIIGAAALAAWAAVGGTNDLATLFGIRMVGIAMGSASQAIPVVAVAAIAGAIVALQPKSRLSAIAAPLAAVTMVGLATETSILRLTLVLAIPALALIALHAALGHWRGWAGVLDDVLGLATLLLLSAILVTGLVTPGEYASIVGPIAFVALALVAIVLRKPGTGRALAAGLGHGIAMTFALVMILMLADPVLRSVSPGEIFAPLRERSGIFVCLALGLVIGGIFGAAVGGVLVALLLVALAGKPAAPTVIAYLAVLASLAGGAFQPWLAPRLAGRIPADNAPSFGAAALAAIPPALAMLALGLFPSLAELPLRLFG